MNQLPVWVNVVIALLAAMGGLGTFGQAVKWYRSYRDGIKQREVEKDERFIERLESRIEYLEIRDRMSTDYIQRLIEALGREGIAIPSRKDMESHPEHKPPEGI